MLHCFKDYKKCIHILDHILEDQIHNGATLHIAYIVNTIPPDALAT